MELWLDTIDRKAIVRAKELGLLHGVTTNPSILAKANSPAEEILDDLLSHFSGPLAVQVVLPIASEMVEQGRDLYDYSDRIIVKVPVTEEGVGAIARLHHMEIPTMATAIFTPLQALMAAQAGASYIVPYFSHIGEQALETVSSIQQMLKENRYTAKLLVASLRSTDQIEQCAIKGVHALTLSSSLFQQSLKTPLQTLEHLKRFEADWQTTPPSSLLPSKQYII